MRFFRRHETARTFATWAEAAAACGQGYEGQRLLTVIHEKTRRYRDSLASHAVELDPVDARVALGVALSALGTEVRVLDFGGACGSHCFVARTLFANLQLRWCVVETPGMVEVAKGLEDEGLSFVSDIPTAIDRMGGVDLVLSSGSLHYVPEPWVTLSELVACEARTLLLTRLVLTDGQDMFSIQRSMLADNGRGPIPPGVADDEICYPIAVVNRHDFEAVITERYKVRARLLEERRVHVAGALFVDHIGYLGERIGA